MHSAPGYMPPIPPVIRGMSVDDAMNVDARKLETQMLDERLAAAREVLSGGDLALALETWEALIADYPRSPVGWLGKGETLERMGRIEDAEAVFAETMRKLPADPWAPLHHAGMAIRRGDWEAALTRAQRVCYRFNDFAPGYIRCAEALIGLGRLDEAEALYGDAIARFPDDLWVAAGRAGVATARRDWPAALVRWQAIRERHPDFTAGYLGEAEALRALGRGDEEAALLALAGEKFPDDQNLAANFARIAMRPGSLDEAARRWQAVLERFPVSVDAYVGKVSALRGADEFDAAEAVIAEAAEHFPDDPSWPEQLALVARMRRETEQHLAWWQEAREWFSQYPTRFEDPDERLADLVQRVFEAVDYPEQLLETMMSPDLQQQPQMQAALFEAVLAQKPVQHFWVLFHATHFYEALRRDEASHRAATGALVFDCEPALAQALHRYVFRFLRNRERYAEAVALALGRVDDAPEKPFADGAELAELALIGLSLGDDPLSLPPAAEAPARRIVRAVEPVVRAVLDCRLYGPAAPFALAELGTAAMLPPIDVTVLRDAQLLICNDTTVVVDAAGNTVAELSVAADPDGVRRKVERLVGAGLGQEMSAATAIQLSDKHISPNLAHFLLDHVTRLELYRQAGVDTAGALAVTGPIATDFQKSILAALGVDRHVDVGRVARITAGELAVASNCADVRCHAHEGSAWAIDYVRRTFGAPAPADPAASRLFVSRADHGSRTIHNEDEVVRELERWGFTTIYPGQLPFDRQVAAFAGATHVVGMHGAGLTNAVFAPAGCAVMEIFHPLYYVISYSSLADSAGWRYAAMCARDWQFDTPEYNDPALSGHRPEFSGRNVRVDLDLLRQWLEEYAGA